MATTKERDKEHGNETELKKDDQDAGREMIVMKSYLLPKQNEVLSFDHFRPPTKIRALEGV